MIRLLETDCFKSSGAANSEKQIEMKNTGMKRGKRFDCILALNIKLQGRSTSRVTTLGENSESR